MAHFKKPAPGQDLSQRDLAAALAEDENATLKGEVDLGLDDDPDLRTRPGQASLLRPKRKSRLVPALAVLAVLAILAVGAWIAGGLARVGGPPPPEGLQHFLGSSAEATIDPASVSAPAPTPVKPKARAPAGRRTRPPGSK